MLRRLSGILLALALLAACTDSTVPPSLRDLFRTIESGNYATLVAALREAGLDGALSDAAQGTFTVFTPTEAAFNARLADLDLTVEEFLALDDLSDILRQHVVAGRYLVSDLVDLIAVGGGGAELPTLGGGTIALSLGPNGTALGTLDGGSVVIDGRAAIVAPDVLASNGVIHGIDAVLTLPSDPDPVDPEPSNRPTSLAQVRGLTSAEPFDGTTVRNCTANEFSTTGQGLNALGSGLNALGSGLNALGSVGGLFLLGPGTADGAPTVRLLEAAEAGAYASTVAGLLGEETSFVDSAILVVDDFRGLTPDAFGQRPRHFVLDAALTSPQNDLTPEAMATIVETGAFSHGALVMHQIVQMVEAAGYTELQTPPASQALRAFMRPYDGEFYYDYSVLVIGAVDTAGFDTDVIAERIANALDALRLLAYEADGVVDVSRVAVNMSFAIVPCDVLEDATAAGLETFEDYVDALGAENDVALDFYAELTELLLTPVRPNLDPLIGLPSSGVVCDLGPQGLSQPPLGAAVARSDVRPHGQGVGWAYELVSEIWVELVEVPEQLTAFLNARYGGFPPDFDWGDCDQHWQSTSVVYVASAGNFGLGFPMYPAAWPLVVGTSSQDGAAAPANFTSQKSSFSNSGQVMAPGALFELGRSPNGERSIAYAGTSFAAPVVSLFTALDLKRPTPKCALPTTSRLAEATASANVALPLAVTLYCP